MLQCESHTLQSVRLVENIVEGVCQLSQRTPHSSAHSFCDMGVDHYRLHVRMAKQHLYLLDRFSQCGKDSVGCEASVTAFPEPRRDQL